MTYIAEITSLPVPMPSAARMFVLIDAPSLAAAISAVNGLGILRYDKRIQIDLYERRGDALGCKVWSGLHRVPAVRPELRIVGA